MSIMFSSLMINNILFLLTKNPLILSVTLLMQALYISVILVLFTKTPWISYALVMVFMSAVMMIFLYFSSLMSNTPFYLLHKETLLSLLLFTTIMTVYLMSLPELIILNKTTLTLFLPMKKIYSNSYFFITTMIMALLFIALTVVTTNTRNCKKPLRTY